jgi:conjugal transfer ATP-binding protein TraC
VMSIMNQVRQMAMNYPNDPKILLMDEAWFLLEDNASAKFVEECFRTFRKLNVSIIGVSQGIREWLVNDNAAAILLNVSTYLILNQTNPKAVEDAKALLDLTDAECQIIGNLKKVKGDYAQALMFQKFEGGNFSTVVLNRTTPLQNAIMTTHPKDKQKIEEIRRELGLTALEARLEFSRQFPRGM